MAELGIGHSSPYDGDPALITPLPASRKPAFHRVQKCLYLFCLLLVLESCLLIDSPIVRQLVA